ncbi:hypothetical protein AVEN_43694-1 [Araneus ventricosus]|uniref:Peptidase aspartic putative domain-containing protein n=1 Tax=Araneus ventricosus TaxID=182803 RepID=A0A4Y2BVT8_ARAVE|nr:hypothetical protein AVEN_43694-1 [Araneus ventricosus]
MSIGDGKVDGAELHKRNSSRFEKEEEVQEREVHQDEALANICRVSAVVLQTLVVIVRGVGVKRRVRAIIDSGSQRSYILKTTAEKWVTNQRRKSTFSINCLEGQRLHIVNMRTAIVYDTMSPLNLKAYLIESSNQEIQLTDDIDGPIEILIGADAMGKLITGNCEQFKSGLTAIETKLGWTVIGRTTNSESTTLLTTSMFAKTACISGLWTLDSLGITEPASKSSDNSLSVAEDKSSTEGNKSISQQRDKRMETESFVSISNDSHRTLEGESVQQKEAVKHEEIVHHVGAQTSQNMHEASTDKLAADSKESSSEFYESLRRGGNFRIKFEHEKHSKKFTANSVNESAVKESVLFSPEKSTTQSSKLKTGTDQSKKNPEAEEKLSGDKGSEKPSEIRKNLESDTDSSSGFKIEEEKPAPKAATKKRAQES